MESRVSFSGFPCFWSSAKVVTLFIAFCALSSSPLSWFRCSFPSAWYCFIYSLMFRCIRCFLVVGMFWWGDGGAVAAVASSFALPLVYMNLLFYNDDTSISIVLLIFSFLLGLALSSLKIFLNWDSSTESDFSTAEWITCSLLYRPMLLLAFLVPFSRLS